MKRKGSRVDKKTDKEVDSSHDSEALESDAAEIGDASEDNSTLEQGTPASKKKKGGKTKRGRKSVSKHDESESEEDAKKSNKRKSAGKKTSKKVGSDEEDEENDPGDAEKNGDIHENKTKKSSKGDDSGKKKKDNRKSSSKKSKKDADKGSDAEDSDDDEPEQKKSKKGKKNDEDEEEEEDDDAEYEVEEVIGERTIKGTHQYLIRWKGYGPDGDTWEQESTLNCKDLIKKFHESQNDSDHSKTTHKKKTESKKKKKTAVKEPEVDWSSDDEFEVDRILEVHFKRNGQREFLVSWKGYPSSQDSWEPEENLDCTDLITKFMDKVEAAKVVDSKDLRIKRAQTERFTLQMSTSARRLSRRIGSKQRVQYHDAE